MSERPTAENDATERLAECLRLLDAKDYFNGGQTVRARFPMGSEERARIVAEAAFWQSRIGVIPPGETR